MSLKKLELESRLIVITGATKGLGLHFAKRFLQSGYSVLGCGRSKSSVQHTHYFHIEADIGNEEERTALIAHIKKEKLKPYALINNAAVGALNQFLTTPTSKVEEILKINYLANFELSRELGKLMTVRNMGRIVNIGSQTLALKTPLEAAYASSKAAVQTLTQIMAKEMAPFGVTVNMVSPAVMETDLIKGISQERIDYMLAQQPIPKPIPFEDVFHTVNFLIGEGSGLITGQNIYLGGVMP